jgi:excisionase family DNA binding protein
VKGGASATTLAGQHIFVCFVGPRPAGGWSRADDKAIAALTSGRDRGQSVCPRRSDVGLKVDRKDAVDLNEQLLRPSEVKDMLNVSRSWLYLAAQSGRIPCVRLGGPDGPVRFVRRDIERWLEQTNTGIDAYRRAVSARSAT